MTACTGTTRNDTPCRARPLKGTDRCLAHSDAKVREKVGFIPNNGKAGRPRIPRPTEVLREIVEADVLKFIEPELRILGLEVAYDEDGRPHVQPSPGGGAKLYGTSKDGYVNVSRHEDLGAMAAAANRIFDRVWGRPRQQVEHSGPDGGPVRTETSVDLSRLSVEDRRALLALVSKAGGSDGD